MRLLAAIMLERAQEQMQGIPPDEGHDPWRIGSAKDDFKLGRLNGKGKEWRRERCLAGDCTRLVRRGSYCAMHRDRVERGLPVDAEFWIITTAEYRRLSEGKRFGGDLWLGRGPRAAARRAKGT